MAGAGLAKKHTDIELRVTALAPPTSASVEEERRHRKERLAATFRIYSRLGFDLGIGGHVTVRDPEHSDRFWVNPFGMHFSKIRVSDLICVDHDGRVVEGSRPVNAAAFAIHSRIHIARPEVVAIAHAHTVYGVAWASLNRLIDPISQEACSFYGDHAVFDEYSGVVLDLDEGSRIAAVLGAKKAVILRNHGLLTVGHSVDEAAWWLIRMDRACQVQMIAEAAGHPQRIPHETALSTQKQIGSSTSGWTQFQPLWQLVLTEEPDFLE